MIWSRSEKPNSLRFVHNSDRAKGRKAPDRNEDEDDIAPNPSFGVFVFVYFSASFKSRQRLSWAEQQPARQHRQEKKAVEVCSNRSRAELFASFWEISRAERVLSFYPGEEFTNRCLVSILNRSSNELSNDFPAARPRSKQRNRCLESWYASIVS
jgi:hypothetical protein